MNHPSAVHGGTVTGEGRWPQWLAHSCRPLLLALWPCSLIPARLDIFTIKLRPGWKVPSGVHYLAYFQTIPHPAVLVVVWPTRCSECCCLPSPVFLLHLHRARPRGGAQRSLGTAPRWLILRSPCRASPAGTSQLFPVPSFVWVRGKGPAAWCSQPVGCRSPSQPVWFCLHLNRNL